MSAEAPYDISPKPPLRFLSPRRQSHRQPLPLYCRHHCPLIACHRFGRITAKSIVAKTTCPIDSHCFRAEAMRRYIDRFSGGCAKQWGKWAVVALLASAAAAERAARPACPSRGLRAPGDSHSEEGVARSGVIAAARRRHEHYWAFWCPGNAPGCAGAAGSALSVPSRSGGTMGAVGALET